MGIIHTDADLDEFDRYEVLECALAEVIATCRPDVAVVEQFMHFFRASSDAMEESGSRRGRHTRVSANPDAMFKLKGAQTTVVQTCLRLGLGVVRYYPGQWKGNGQKEGTRRLMTALYRQAMPNADTADAIGLAHHYLTLRRSLDPVAYAGAAPPSVDLYRAPVDPYAKARAALKGEAAARGRLPEAPGRPLTPPTGVANGLEGHAGGRGRARSRTVGG